MTTRVSSGQRDREVVVQALTESIASSGFPIESWATLRTVKAQKLDMTDNRWRERFISNQNSAPADTRWSLPYSADYDPELVDVSKVRRLVYRGRTYDIIAALMVGRREGVEFATLSSGAVA